MTQYIFLNSFHFFCLQSKVNITNKLTNQNKQRKTNNAIKANNRKQTKQTTNFLLCLLSLDWLVYSISTTKTNQDLLYLFYCSSLLVLPLYFTSTKPVTSLVNVIMPLLDPSMHLQFGLDWALCKLRIGWKNSQEIQFQI